MQYSKHKLGSANVHFLKTKKFKTIHVNVKLSEPLNRIDATKRALLPLILLNGTKSYNSQKAISTALEDLYGANISAIVGKKGLLSVLTFYLSIPNERFVKEPLLDNGLHILSEVIKEPYKENHVFKEHYLKSAKRELKERLESIYDDKMRFSVKRLIEEMSKDQEFGVFTDGYIDEINNVSNDQLSKYHQLILNSNAVDIFVVGDFEEVSMLEALKNHLYFETSHPEYEVINKNSYMRDCQEVSDQQNISQGKLNLGYTTSVNISDRLYFPMQVMNGILGAFSHSKLFINVREKASLAYYAASRYDSFTGLLIIFSGIEFENYKETIDIISKQTEAMKLGDFSTDEINDTKVMITNGISESFDHASGTIDFYFSNQLSKLELSPKGWIEKVNSVTKEEIIEAAKTINLDTIYFLKGSEINEENALS